jgi:hypothetical protein
MRELWFFKRLEEKRLLVEKRNNGSLQGKKKKKRRRRNNPLVPVELHPFWLYQKTMTQKGNAISHKANGMLREVFG